MATSGTTTSGPTRWAQLSGRPHPSAAAFGCSSDSVVVTATSSPTINGPATAVPKGATTQQPGIEGRVGKPARRRSRASRRTPTTMLNTDTTNFRAMVQQFTGIPSGPSLTGYRQLGGSGTISNVVGYNFPEPIQQATLMSFGHLQPHQYQGQGQSYQSITQEQQQQQCQPASDHGTLAAIGGGNNSNINDGLLQRFKNAGTNMEVGDGFFFDGMYSQMMARATSTNNSGHGYFS